MLKGFVSGEEKDIKRIPMKGKNLFDPSTATLGKYINAQGVETASSSQSVTEWLSHSDFFAVVPNESYTLSSVKSSSVQQTVAFCWYDATKTFLSRTTEQKTIGTTTYSITGIAPSDACFAIVNYTTANNEVMLNLGSTALPYEPYGYKEGWEVRDNQDRLIWGREDELQTATDTLPFKGYSLPVKVKSLLGNAVQNGTPSPQSIIMPTFCGVRTGNLWDEDYTGISGDLKYAPVYVGDGTFTLSTDTPDYSRNAPLFLLSGNVTSGASTPVNGVYNGTSRTMNSSNGYITIAFRRQSESTSPATHKTMLNSGITALPYEPFGWAEKITCAGQTVPVYLGQVQTVRRVKKLVLDGTETVSFNAKNGTRGRFAVTIPLPSDGTTAASNVISTHFATLDSTDKILLYTGVCMRATGRDIVLAMSYSEASVVAPTDATMLQNAVKSYLAAQYAAGTPVTIWYVLANEQTGIVNEPLAKIGTYADELTTIQVHGLSAPLYGIGDYKDTLNLSTGVVTRKVGKLVLTGEENIEIKSGNAKWYIPIADMKTPATVVAIEWYCSHYQAVANNASWVSYDYMISWSSKDTDSSIGLRIRDIDFLTGATLADFKSYLAAQYQAGTPVTIWYVLNTPTTETVTVPTGMTGEIEGYLTQVSTPTPTKRSVPKWNGEEESGGTYAVTVYTPPEIPTTTGENTLTVDTTLAPYEVTVEGHIKYGYWGKIREYVRSGVAQTKFPVGTIFYDNEDETTGTAFQVIGYDKHFDPEMTARGYTHSMTLCELKLTDLVTFDATEALLYVETAIAPGTYRFKIPNYDATYGGNKSYYFTTTKFIPVGGQITINWPYQQTPKTASTYSEIAGVTAIESGLTLSEWIEGDSPAAIDLGTAAGPNAELGTSSFGKMNHIHRARYGSNNYLQSGIRQYINSDKAANSWWSPQTVFDRPYGSRTSAGKLTKLSSEFVDVLVKPTIKSRTNSYFETDSLDGTKFSVSTDYTITTDKMFLLSPNEVGLNADTTIGSTLDYYLNATNTDRIKNRASNETAYYWWLRTPNPPNASSVRAVHTSGALNGGGATSTFGVAAACVIQ